MKQYIVDSFTDALFTGNPADILPCWGWCANEKVQQWRRGWAYAKKEGREEERERIAEKLRKEGVSEDVIARVIETK